MDIIIRRPLLYLFACFSISSICSISFACDTTHNRLFEELESRITYEVAKGSDAKPVALWLEQDLTSDISYVNIKGEKQMVNYPKVASLAIVVINL
jgi:hypothetical protein